MCKNPSKTTKNKQTNPPKNSKKKISIVYFHFLKITFVAGELLAQCAPLRQLRLSARCWVCFLGKPSSGWFRPLLLGEEVSSSTWGGSGPWGRYPPRAGAGWRAAGDWRALLGIWAGQEQLLPGSSSCSFSLGADSSFTLLLSARGERQGEVPAMPRSKDFLCPATRRWVPALHENLVTGWVVQVKRLLCIYFIISLLHQSETSSRW